MIIIKITVAQVNNIQEKNFILHRPNGRDDYLFVLFKSPAMVMVNDSYVQVDHGDCILFDRHKIQSYYPCEGYKFIHDFIHFDTENDEEHKLVSEIPAGEVINISAPELISDAIYNIMCEQEREHSKYKNDIFNLLASMFLYRIKNELSHKTSGNIKKQKNYRLLRELRENIYRCPGKKISIDEAAESVYLSRYYFQHLYKQLFSVSFQKDIINARIITSKRLLLNSDLTVKEIALSCGYQNTEHFVKQFKSEVGISPGKFRLN